MNRRKQLIATFFLFATKVSAMEISTMEEDLKSSSFFSNAQKFTHENVTASETEEKDPLLFEDEEEMNRFLQAFTRNEEGKIFKFSGVPGVYTGTFIQEKDPLLFEDEEEMSELERASFTRNEEGKIFKFSGVRGVYTETFIQEKDPLLFEDEEEMSELERASFTRNEEGKIFKFSGVPVVYTGTFIQEEDPLLFEDKEEMSEDDKASFILNDDPIYLSDEETEIEEDIPSHTSQKNKNF